MKRRNEKVKRRCKSCNKLVNNRNLIPKEDNYYCKQCYKKKFQTQINLGFNDVNHPPKDVVYGKGRFYKPKPKVRAPKIPGAKKPKIKKFETGLSLTVAERNFLYKKYVERGLSSYKAREKIKEITVKLNEIISNLREEAKLSEQQVVDRFKEEFAKLKEMA